VIVSEQPVGEHLSVVGDLYTPLGTQFTPSMMLAYYHPERGWGEMELGSRRPLQLDPATMALHYGQAAFEGIKAHRQPDGSFALFRPAEHAARLRHSCERLAIPPIPTELCVDWWRAFTRFEQPNLLAEPGSALYLRPLIFGMDPVLGSRPSTSYCLLLLGIQTRSTDATRSRRLEVLITTDYVRSVPGGLGSVKVPGNYAAGMLAHRVAMDQGCDQVLWLDAGRRRWVEELGSMNVMFVIDSGLVTPALTDTILPGVTRDAVLALARESGIDSEERPIALEEITAALSWRGLTEAFACSTGVGITPIRGFRLGADRIELPEHAPIADRLRALLEDYQQGRVPDRHGWRVSA
jgi:branched-chain amino acid aminotransferase